ncbi:MAG: PEP-CTERM sorting domain-containing protein [Pirellulales bacterium]
MSRKNLWVGLVVAMFLLLSCCVSAQAGNILLVTDDAWAHSRAPGQPNEPPPGDLPEDDLTAFLESTGHTVFRSAPGQYSDANEGPIGAAAFAAINAVDLIIMSRALNADSYAANPTSWNLIPAPLLNMSPALAQSNRWQWVNNVGSPDESPAFELYINQPSHPFIAGRGSDLFDLDSPASPTRLATADPGNGNLVASLPDGNIGLVEWAAGMEFEVGGTEFAGAQRVLFPGLRYHEDEDAGPMGMGNGVPLFFSDFTDNARAILAQTVDAMIAEPSPLYDGDVDTDGDVDIFDVAVLQVKYGMTSGAIWADGDFDGNGTVDIFDVALLQPNYGIGVGTGSITAVPEPSSLALAVFGLGALLAWRRRS